MFQGNAAATAATDPERAHTRTHTLSHLPYSLKIILANEILRDYSVSMAATLHRSKKNENEANKLHVFSHANNIKRNFIVDLIAYARARSPATAFYARKQIQRHHVFILF